MPKHVAYSFLSFVFSTVVLSCLIGCGKAEPPPMQQAAKPKCPTVGVSLWNIEDPWRAQMKAEIEAEAAKHPEIAFVIKDAQNDAERQKTDVEQLLADSVKLIIVSPKNAQLLAEPLTKAFDAGIPVIVLDRPLIGEKYTCYIAANQEQIGKAVGTWLGDKLAGKGKIVEIKGPVDSLLYQERHTAFRAALRDPGYRFVFEGHVDPPKVDAAQVMKEALAAVEQIDAVFAYSDEAAQAAYEVAKSAGREKNTLFIGINALPHIGQKLVEEGTLNATFSCPTGGVEAIDAAVKLLAGQKPPKSIPLETRPFTQKASSVPSNEVNNKP